MFGANVKLTYIPMYQFQTFMSIAERFREWQRANFTKLMHGTWISNCHSATASLNIYVNTVAKTTIDKGQYRGP